MEPNGNYPEALLQQKYYKYKTCKKKVFSHYQGQIHRFLSSTVKPTTNLNIRLDNRLTADLDIKEKLLKQNRDTNQAHSVCIT